MKYRLLMALALVAWFASVPTTHAQTPTIAQTEINYLLTYVEKSACEFHRNGSWYDSKKAQAHLRYKYDALAAANRIHSAEDFIEMAATKSSFTGLAYEIRCGDEVVTTNQWLRLALARYRAVDVKNPPSVTPGGF